MYTIKNFNTRFLPLVALIIAIVFTMIQVIAFIQPYPYFVSSDSYRDFKTINSYLLQNQVIPYTVSYHDRPVFLYLVDILHQFTGITVFDLLRIGIPVIFCLSIASFYLFYKEAFHQEWLALGGTLITVLSYQFFQELIAARPNIMALILFPTAGFFFLRLCKEKNNIWIALGLIATSLAVHFSHFSGTLLLGILCFGVIILYRSVLLRYWLWVLLSITALAVISLLMPSNLLVSTVAHAFRIVIGDSTVLQAEGLIPAEISIRLGAFTSMLGTAGLVVILGDLIWMRAVIRQNFSILLIGVALFIFGLFTTWIGPLYGYSILPSRMLVYLWLGVAIMALYVLSRLQSSMIVICCLGMSLAFVGLMRLPYAAKDLGYILGNEIEITSYLQTHNIDNAVILTQQTNTPVFATYNNGNILIANSDKKNTKLFNKIFFATSGEAASAAIETTLQRNAAPADADVYIAYSTVKSLNTSFWNNDWFREQSLDDALLTTFNDRQFFIPSFDNGDIHLWKWTPPKR